MSRATTWRLRPLAAACGIAAAAIALPALAAPPPPSDEQEQIDALRTLVGDLVRVPAPTGFEDALREKIAADLPEWADGVRTDNVGNLIVPVRSPERPLPANGARGGVMIVATMDEPGFVVSAADERGYLRLMPAGDDFGDQGPAKFLPGRTVEIVTADGVRPGAVLAPSIHLRQMRLRRPVRSVLDDVFIDVGADSREQAERLIFSGVALRKEVVPMAAGRLGGTFVADRANLGALLAALRSGSKPLAGASVTAAFCARRWFRNAGFTRAGRTVQPGGGVVLLEPAAEDESIKLGDGVVVSAGDAGTLSGFIADRAKAYGIRVQRHTQGPPAPSGRSAVPIAVIGVPARHRRTPAEVVDLRDVNELRKILALLCGSWAPPPVEPEPAEGEREGEKKEEAPEPEKPAPAPDPEKKDGEAEPEPGDAPRRPFR